MAVVAPSLLRATGTYNFDFRLSAAARGLAITSRITAKGAGAATLTQTLQFYDEASGFFIPLTDSTAAAPVAVSQTPGIAVAASDNFRLVVYPSFGQPAPAQGKNMFFSAAVPSSLRLVCVVAVDTITFSVGAKSLY